MKDLALLVMSCDKYSSVWYPYFELIKKYWPDHPEHIYLSSETRGYSCEGLDITVINSNKVEPWSQRLLDVLTQIKEEFIVFSLEDFFLLGKVNTARIKECLRWMREDSSIAECRLTTYDTVTAGDYYKGSDFRICPANHPYRVDTQVAVWRKSYLMSVINPMETPWQFEGRASARSSSKPDKLLWLSPTPLNIHDLDAMIVPYFNRPADGYGIAWGKWLPNNKKWFENNGIHGVKFHRLGSLSKEGIDRRNKYLYVVPTTPGRKAIKTVYQLYVYADRMVRGFMINGMQDVRNTLSILKSRRIK